MSEPIKIEAYHCPVCEQDLIRCSLRSARKHTKVPIDETKLPVGLFYIGSVGKTETWYYMITSNDSGLEMDHSFLHSFDVLTYGVGGLHEVSGEETSYRKIADKFRKGISRFLSREEFGRIFSDSRNLLVLNSNTRPLRTYPELEGLVVL